MLRKVLVGAAISVILFLFIGFLLPKRVNVSKTISIHAPVDYVFEEINEVERWSNWFYPLVTNRALDVTYGGQKSGWGANFKWPHGEVFIVETRSDTLIRAMIQLPSDVVKSSYRLTQKGDTTLLTASMTREKQVNLFERWYSLLFTTLFSGKSVSNEIKRIKEIAEGKPIFSIPITMESLAPTYYIHLSEEINRKNTSETLSKKNKMFEELKKVAYNSNTQRIAPPFCIYPNLNKEKSEIVCAFTIPPDARFPKNYPVLQHYSGAAVRGIHSGGHATLKKTHDEVLSYMRYKNLKRNGDPWEVYLSDLTNEKDSMRWMTEVYYPVK